MSALPLDSRLAGVRIAAIGASAGAIDALVSLLPALPRGLPFPVLLVVHVAADRTSLLPEVLARHCALPVVHASGGELLLPGKVYVAPPAHHLLVDAGGRAVLSDAPPVRFARPAVDSLFESVARCYGKAALGVVLTGANTDGAKGLAAIARSGGVTVVQSPDEAAVDSMPNAAIAAANPDRVLPLAGIGRLLATAGSSAATPLRHRPRLLLVDDIPENLVALEALLGEEDVEILPARSGREALELLLAHEVALALVDVHMPELDGFELAELMRGSARTRNVPIIFVTAGAREQARIFRGYEAGAVDYLLKPIEPLVLRNKVRTFLQLYRQRQQLGEQVEQLQRATAEKQRLVEELSETLRLNELFLAALGHDLRSPITAISVSAQLLGRASKEEQTRRIATRIGSSSKVMTQMIESLLDVAQARSGGGLRLRTERLDLGAVADAALGEVRAAAADRQVEVHATGSLEGVWDPSRIHRVLSNLLGNALRHGAADAPVRLELDGAAADRVAVRVQNGGAIPPPLLATLFDPFRTNERGEGLGLGLYIVREIALAHGGAVTVRSTPEEGTCVEVTLRRAVAGHGEAAAAEDADERRPAITTT
ncbi:chemotaxis protein CheB [Vulgatibacter sp.]|uniref:chemotaxis protein CheB n=1 Tax=Vulgatibacter sp. TaxID=1971226 RepID=UPI003563CFB4